MFYVIIIIIIIFNIVVLSLINYKVKYKLKWQKFMVANHNIRI